MSQQTVAINRENITTMQISVLLNTITTMQAGLREWPTESNGVPSTNRLDGEGRVALETSLIKACERLDEIVSDKSRWGIDRLLEIERKLDETLAAQNDFFKSQKAAADDTRRPHRFLSPDLRLTPHGWCAWYGDVSDDASLITGIGDSPAEAMAAFDEAYYRKLTPAELPNPLVATASKYKSKSKSK